MRFNALTRADISITSFVARPQAPKLAIEHIHAFRVFEASNAPVRTYCEAGRPVKAMKYWDRDFRSGKGGW